MRKETLEQIIKTDIFGLLQGDSDILRWGIVYGRSGGEKRALAYRYNDYLTARNHANEMIKDNFEGCIYKEINKDGEWQLVATEEF